MFCKKGVLRNFANFARKHLCQSIRPEACNFNKKETLVQVFSCEFYEISKNTFFTEHLWWLLLIRINLLHRGPCKIHTQLSSSILTNMLPPRTLDVTQYLVVLKRHRSFLPFLFYPFHVCIQSTWSVYLVKRK